MRKVALISREIPGSGKSTFNGILKRIAGGVGVSVAIHSTDDRFMVNGKYVFDFAKLHPYHMGNLRDFTSSVASNTDIVVVDNTNIKARDYKPYIEAARERGYYVMSLILKPDDLANHFTRQSHGVPLDKLEIMRDSLIASGATIGVDEELVIDPVDFSESHLIEVSKTICNRLFWIK